MTNPSPQFTADERQCDGCLDWHPEYLFNDEATELCDHCTLDEIAFKQGHRYGNAATPALALCAAALRARIS